MRQIHFLPYLEIEKEFIFGDVVFWPFWRLKSRRIKDERVRIHLEWYFKKWRDNLSNKRLNITIVSIKERLIESLPDDERERIQVACNILFLLHAPQNDHFWPLSSDNFTMYTKNFEESEYRLVSMTGSYIRKEGLFSSKMTKKIKFVKPDYVPSTRSSNQFWFYDMKYYRAVRKAFNQKYNENWFLHFRRSLEVFISSYSNVHSLSYFNRIVSLVTAIEILLDLDTSGSSKFTKGIIMNLGFNNNLCRISQELTKINRNIRKFSQSLYDVRSKFVHGKEMSDNDINHPEFGEYYKKGVRLYYEMVKPLLEKNNCFKKRKIVEKYYHLHFNLFPLISEEEAINSKNDT